MAKDNPVMSNLSGSGSLTGSLPPSLAGSQVSITGPDGVKKLHNGSQTISAGSHSSIGGDGCIVLGKHGASGIKYKTRYRINRKEQRDKLCQELLREACLPCCQPKYLKAPLRGCWAFLQAEAFLITLHLGVIVLGAVKEALNLRAVDEDLHLIHSVVETFVALLQICIRISIVVKAFKEIKKKVYKIQEVDDCSKGSVRGRKLRAWLILYVIQAIFLIIIGIVAFLLFYFLAHLGWTILSNNFILVLIMVTSNLFMDRLNSIQARISKDHHTAVIYETLLLLNEGFSSKSQLQKEQYHAKVTRFAKALKDTEEFSEPSYMELHEKRKPRWDSLTTMTLQSSV